MAQFAPEAGASLDHVSPGDHSAAQAGADNRRNRGSLAVAAEDIEVTPERAGVAVVQISYRLADLGFQAGPDIEAGPIGMDEIRGPSRAQYACGAGGTGSVQPDDGDIRGGDS